MSDKRTPAEQAHDPAATDVTSENARDGARKRRDPDEPSAVIGIGASAGGIAPLQQFFADMSPESGLAFVVVMHLSPEHESNLAPVIQQKTSMPVTQVKESVKVRRNHVYVIPPNHQLTFEQDTLHLIAPQKWPGKRGTIDLFFRTLAQAFGPRALCVILSGIDSDGAIGVKHVRAQGGVTIAQDPNEAEHDRMPLDAIATGSVDWVMPVAQMPAKLLEFVRNENAMQLPPEIPEAVKPDMKVADAPGGETLSNETRAPEDEAALVQVLAHLQAQTGHDFQHYKRATVLRRIARRLQVNSLESIPQYLDFIRTRAPESRALLQDMLIGVTHFFRDRESFAALEAHVPQLFAGKTKNDQVRVWVTGCATGEEAYSIAMLLCEHAERIEDPPAIQVFASDIDEEAIQEARNGLYPSTTQADVSQERLRRFFATDQGRYRVRKSLREKVLFSAHNLLSDPPFSRVDLATCRNLLIYLNEKAQEQVFDIFHFALRSGGLLFVGSAENSGALQGLFSPVDGKHRIYVRRSVPRPAWKLPASPVRTAEPLSLALPMLHRSSLRDSATNTDGAYFAGQERRAAVFGELHLNLLEQYAPPSIVVSEENDIVHLSDKAGRYLRFTAGEPSMNLFRIINPALQIELRTALFRAAQGEETSVATAPQTVHFDGRTEVITMQVLRIESAQGEKYFLVMFEEGCELAARAADSARAEDVTRGLDDEIDYLKKQLSNTVELYEASGEELKASNEELQATNEELLSATEELETSKEELQSVNEELTAVNAELKNSVEDLSRSNSDLSNLMASTDIGTIFLDRELRIQRFTPSAQKVFNLLPADLKRPLADITHQLQYGGLLGDAQNVLDTLQTIEREVRGGEKAWYLARIAPYRTSDDHIAGVVATFIDITRRKHAEMNLESELRYGAMFEQANVGIVQIADGGHFLAANPGFCQFIGYTEKELKRMRVRDITHPDDYPREEELTRELAAGEINEYTLEKRYLRKDGELVWGSMTAKFVRPEGGQPLYTLAIVHAIGARKEAEEQLRGSEERLRVALQGAEMATWDYDVEADRVIWNEQHFHLFGLTPDGREKTAEYFLSFVHPDDLERIREELRKAVEETGVYRAEFRIVRKGGEVRWMSGFGQALERRDGRTTRMTGVMFDINERRGAEEALRESEERLRTIADNVPQVIWTNHGNGHANYFNRRWYEYSGLSLEESLGLGWQAIVHPEDAPDSVQRWQQALNEGEVFESEYRLRRHDGEHCWFIGRNVPLRENGVVVSWFGSATDIDDFKQAQAKLGETEEKFRLLVEGAREYAMFLLSPDNVVTFWSRGAERVLGWSQEEAVGQSGDLIFTPEDRAAGAVEKEFEIALKEGRAPDRRYHLRKDGSRFWADGVMMRLDNESGGLRGMAKVARDASDERDAAEALTHARDELEQRVLERTQDVLATNSELERTIADRLRLEKELLAISEREKRRIGEDLHDMVCQELTATALFLKTSAKKVARESASAAKTLEESAQLVNRNVGLARDLARGLQPADLKGAGLKRALQSLAEQACDNGSIKCHFKATRGTRVTDDTMALHLYRVAQEALKNAIKHSGAKNILITLDHSSENVCVTVQDNGKGFSQRRRTKGLGLHLMRYRANVLGGELKISKRRSGGTEVTCIFPANR